MEKENRSQCRCWSSAGQRGQEYNLFNQVGVRQSFRYLNDPPPQETGLYDAGKEVWLSGESWGRSRICWGGLSHLEWKRAA